MHHCTKQDDGTDTTDWSYVYFGSYPQTEVTGSALTAEITGASYDGNGDAWVDGVKYRRASKSDTNYDAYFGSSTYRYFKWERIKWRVLDNNGSTLFVVADKGLDCKNYNEKWDHITWENCTLRNWLNNDFYRTAFDGGEQGAIVEQTVRNEDNPYFWTEGGNDTRDRVFLLSIGEVLSPGYGFCEDYDTYSVGRRVKASDYAYAMGAWITTSDTYRGNSWWWVRSPGYITNDAAYVSDHGYVNENGVRVLTEYGACVPALHINLSSDLWTLAEGDMPGGQVSSFSLDPSLSGSPDKDLTLTGSLTLSSQAQPSASLLQSEIDKITWTSSDEGIVPDSELSCKGVNSYDNRSAELMISFTPKKKGKVKITGKTSNGLTASCEITVGGCIAIDQKANDLEGCTIALSGTLTLEESVKATEANLQAAINSLKFESSDASKAKVLACNAVKSADHRSAKLEIWITLYNQGEATITAKASDGHTAECRVTIQPNTSEDSENYEGDYTSEMREFLNNQGTRNTLKYLCNSGNFTASTFVAEKDAKFGNLLVMSLTDMYYRGWDGWMDLINGSTSVQEAEKTIASLLGAYQKKVEGLSEMKTAQKYAKMLNNAFSDYTKSTNMFAAINSEEIQVVRAYFSDDNLMKLLYNGKYGEIASPAYHLQAGMSQIMDKSAVFQAGTEASQSWNQMMEGFTQSAEVSKALKKGCQSKLGNLEIGGGLSDLGDALKYVSLSQEALNHMYQLETLLTADEMYCEMLLYLKENCVYSVVQDAAEHLYSVINDSARGIMADFKRFATDKLGEQILDLALQAVSEKFYIFAMIKAGFDWGATLSNTFFKTGSTQELKDSLRTQAFLANTLGSWALSKEMEYLSAIGTKDEALKAKELYYSLYLVWESRKCAEETLQSLLKTTGSEWSANYSVSTRISSTLDSFENNIFSEGNMSDLFGISVSCPVDVEVCNAAGEKLLTVKDGTECAGFEKGVYYYCVYNPLSDDYEKYIYFSEDSGYNVKVLGNDLGIVDASVLNVNEDGHLNELYFENTGIEKGTVIDFGDIAKEGGGYKVIHLDGSVTSETMDTRKAEKIATSSISLSANVLELEAGQKQLLAVSFAPANATNQKVAWRSDNESVASVNSDGVVTAAAAGTAVVTVSQGELKQTCKITVREQKTENKPGNNPQNKPNGGNENAKTDIGNAKIFLKKTSYVYDGKKKQPSVTVIVGSQVLRKETDYHVTYQNNKKVGTASIVISGTGAYTGNATLKYKIVPKGTAVSKVTAKSKGFAVSWKKQAKSTDGYQLSYSTNKKFTKKATVTKTVKKSTKTKLDVKKCKAKQKYFIRIRTYKTVKGKKYYSAWSKMVSVKTEK